MAATEKIPDPESSATPKLILGIESSGKTGAVALRIQEESSKNSWITHALSVDGNYTTARQLIPSIKSLMEINGHSVHSVGMVAVTHGPGSFTGLRLGVVAAKTIAYALNCPIVGVNTLDLIAFQWQKLKSNDSDLNEMKLGAKQLVALMDAQRNESFVGTYGFDGQRLVCKRPVEIVKNSHLLTNFSSSNILTGPGLMKICDDVSPGPHIAHKEVWKPQVELLVQMLTDSTSPISNQTMFDDKSNSFDGGDDVWTLEPEYFRKSAAEEKVGLG